MNPVRTELESLQAERTEHDRIRLERNSHVQEYLRISRAEHYTREAIAGEMLAALENMIIYANALFVHHQICESSYNHDLNDKLAADLAQARAIIKKVRGA